jgi:predicted CXXCH cytochrome family protein
MRSKTQFRLAAVIAVALVAAVALAIAIHRRREESGRAARPQFVGSEKCASCHAAESEAWKTSQHSRAMQEARPGAVFGRFDGASFNEGGIRSTFFRRGDRYFVNTEGADGQLHDFQIRYTFGVYPLQQYLVELPAGHVQALLLAWDARPATEGGQRWYSLSSGAVAEHGNEFHWTGRQYNWNYMCADCHSTAVRKGYDARTDEFRTTMSEINVACEACHGPGSSHASWGSYPSFVRRLIWRDDGLPARLTERTGARWSIDASTGNAHRNVPRQSDREIETCAQCHARRSHIAEGYTAGASFFDYYSPLLLLRDLYYPDGQQHDEVYTYASFLQSKMYSAGVTCADCHDPHTQKLRKPGNQVCAQCHSTGKYDASSHHFHLAGSVGAQCVSCHMPDTTYMQIDRRRDHSIRIPRPDLSVSLGVPNACNRCHMDRDAQWAAAEIASRYRTRLPGFQRFAGAFAADDRGDSTAADSLVTIATDASEPAIVRASAIARLGARPEGVTFQTAQAWSRERSPLIRIAALQVLDALPVEQRKAVATPLLRDSARAVRQGAALLLAPLANTFSTAADQRAFADASAEFVDSQRYNADRAPSRLALGIFYAQLGHLDSAATEFRAAVRLSPLSSQAYLALAAVLRAQGRVPAAIAELERARKVLPDDAQIAQMLRSLTATR